MIILAVFFTSTIVDGLASYLGLYETNNIIRFTSGILCGASIMTVLYPVFNFQYYRKPSKVRIFNRPIAFLIFCVILAAFIIFSLLGPSWLGSFYYYFSGVSVILTFFFVSLTMMFLIPGFSQKADSLFTRHLIIPSVLALFLTALELFLAYGMHSLMIRFTA